MDGHRCRPDEDSWACCIAHGGRGKCPRDKPVMCDTLCSGHPTEYCCETEAWKCTPRPCSPFLVGLFCVYLWHRAHKAAQWIDVNIEGAKTDAQPIADRDGHYHVCRRPE